jgi:hypothetical protein
MIIIRHIISLEYLYFRLYRLLHTGPKFWKQLAYLLRLAMPGVASRGVALLGAQFLLLVARTLLTVRVTAIIV